jgi:hypothetical protein
MQGPSLEGQGPKSTKIEEPRNLTISGFLSPQLRLFTFGEGTIEASAAS